MHHYYLQVASILAAASLAATSVVPGDSGPVITAQYYTDGGCEEYLTTFYPFDNDGCYQYQYTGANSGNIIASYDTSILACTWYEGENCSGHSQDTVGEKCASNYGGGWQSIKCIFGA
jgi:hypothetical protein